MPNLATELVDQLARAGVRHAYTVPGESFLGLLDAFSAHPDTSLVSTRHESGAGFMAGATAALTGVPAVALASRGPGACNLSIGVHAAMQDATPMVVLLGQVPTGFLGRGAFQEVDLAAMFAPLAKWSATALTAADVLPLAAQALEEATTGRPGPVVLVLPTDLVGPHDDVDAVAPDAAARTAPTVTETAPSDLAARLVSAQRPVLVAGRGVPAQSPELVEVAEAFGAGVYVAFRCQDRFPVDHPHFLGHLGLGLEPTILDELREADLVVAVGTRWDEVTSQEFTLPTEAAEQYHVATFAPETTAAWLAGDTVGSLAKLLQSAPREPVVRDWTRGHAIVDDWSRLPALDGLADGTHMHPARVIDALQRTLPKPAVVTNDAGNFAAFLHRYWRFSPSVHQVAPMSGAMGAAVPSAVAAAQVAGDRPVVAVVGDGGVLMTGQEIETAARLGLNIVVLVFQNGLYGTIAMHQASEVGRTTAVTIGDVDFAAWGRGLGATAHVATSSADLESALVEAFAHPGPSLVAARTDPDLITPSRRLSELMGR